MLATAATSETRLSFLARAITLRYHCTAVPDQLSLLRAEVFKLQRVSRLLIALHDI
jgi:hypothetical protein